MLHFECDYARGCHPRLMEALCRTNKDAAAGYGEDPYCAEAIEYIRSAIGKPNAQVHFLVGGTQTNATVIAALLSPWQGVISAATGHVTGHEAGAIEQSGHKVITLPSHEGKITPSDLESYMEVYTHDEAREHIVEPGMVYISFPTEYGTIYSRGELEALHNTCRRYDLRLFLDGARLGYGLAAAGDLTLRDIADLCDVFYIGGTKVGALFGEAAVFPEPGLCRAFFTVMKQHGAVLAKGRLLGVQFAELFRDGLYEEISRNAVERARELKDVLRQKGYEFFLETPTNQQFVVVSPAKLRELQEKVCLSVWEPHGADYVIRLCTDWATTPGEIEELSRIL